MTLINRFSCIDKAIIVSTGNSLVVCGDTITLNANTSDMITTAGTATRDYTKAGSSASINILPNSTILYAELIWYSTVTSNDPSALNVISTANAPINLMTPINSITITPQNTEDYTAPSGSIERFRSANVTNIIANSLSGSYTVSNVPTSIPTTGLSDTRAGWTLAVVYRNTSFRPNKINFSSGISYIDQSTPIQTTLTGFTTENDTMGLKGNIVLAAANGNPRIISGSLKAGASFASLVQLGNSVGAPNANPGTTPNNPYNNLFAGQINVCDPLDSSVGLININGTNGSKNHDAFVPTQVLNARNKWDLTNISLNSALSQNQNQVAIQISQNNTNSELELLGLGTQVRALAPNIITTLDAFDSDGDSEYNVEVGEQLIYHVQIKNNGEGPANNVTVTCPIASCCSFIPNSVKINSVTMIGANIANGVNVGTIDPSGVTNIFFSVRVNSQPQNGKFSSIASYHYEFISGSGSPNYINYDNTNTITIIVQSGNLEVTKSVSALNANISDNLLYTINIKNIGSETAQNILFQDVIGSYSTFVTGSVTIDGVNKPTLNPSQGFSLENLLKDASTEIKFSVTVNSLPPSTKIENSSLVTFNYMFNQYPALIEKTIMSNVTSVQVNYVDIVGNRTNNNNYPNVGDQVTYTLTLTNVGNINATDVQVKEPDIPGASFVSGSVTIDGQSKPLLNPFEGFSVATITPQQTVTITYKVLVNEIQPGETVENIAKVPFKYQISSEGPVISTEKDSNKVITRSNFVVMTNPETVDKAYATIEDILYYSVNLTNSGNIDAVNTTFLSDIQSDTTFVAGSVKINGVSYPGYNPNLGFSVGTISPGVTINVSYQAKVIAVPNPNVVYNNSKLIYSYKPGPSSVYIVDTITSNTVQTIINKKSMTINKEVDKAYAQLGDSLVYKTIINNNGTVPLTNVTFVDNLPVYLSFIQGYVVIDGVIYTDINPNNGFSLPDIYPNETHEIVFIAKVITAPPPAYVVNMSQISYSYKVNPSSPTITETTYSNEARTDIINGVLTITKSASKAYATIGDTINYSFNVSNIGNTTVKNTNFKDIVPQGATFVAGSVFINGTSKPSFNPNTGFTIGDLNVGQVVRVSFSVTVNSVPNPNVLNNTASTSFEFKVDPSNPVISKTATSNTASTVINIGSATLTKQVDKDYATINDILTYTVTATNTGTTDLTNVNFLDLVPNGTSFVEGSVVIDGVSKPSYDPSVGFNLSNMITGTFIVVSFKVKVINVPTPPVISNFATINYNYKIDPSGATFNGNKTSNTVTTNINKAAATNVKTVDKSYATIDDELVYTSVITNTGNIDLTNTKFVDVIPFNTSFVSGSVIVNGVSKPEYNPNTGFTLDTISKDNSVTVIFKVKVDSLPDDWKVVNTSNVSYEYKINPNETPIIGNVTSNLVTTNINVGSLTIAKTADRDYARLTDVVIYNFVITNTGNTLLSNFMFQDIIQVESSFNSGSVYVNGVNKPSFNPNTGFALDNIPIGSYVTVKFSVTVNSVPTSGKLYNTGNVNFSYYVNPNGTPVSKKVTSNQTTVNVNAAIISANKSVNKSIAKIGDTLTFTVILNNAGNIAAQRVYFEDILDTNISFDSGSVIVNGVSKPTYDPNNGFSLDDIAGLTSTTVIFTATVMTRPSDNIVENFATIEYEYKPDPGKPAVPVTITTNITTTYIAYGELTLTKAVDKSYATIDDAITYTVYVKNTGSVNATGLSFKDIVPNATSFKEGTVIVNTVNQTSYNPNTGFSLPDLVPNQINVVSFVVNVDSVPVSGKAENTGDVTFSYKLTPTETIETTVTSNKVTTYINLGHLNVNKAVDKDYATIGDNLSYTVTVKNTGNVECSSVLFQDMIQAEGSFVSGSVKVNNVSKPSFNPNTGFNLDNIAPNSIVTITFLVKVNLLPSNYIIYNTSNVGYAYYVNPNNPAILATTISNTVQTRINIGKLSAQKEVSLAYATIGDTVSYTITVFNEGNVNLTSVNFRDVIPSGLNFVTDSVTINGVSKPGYDPYQSFTLGTVILGESVVVKFDTLVTSLPTPSLVSNTANLTFAYKIDPSGQEIISEITSNTVTTQINKGEMTLTKQVDKAWATIGDILTYTVVVNNTGNIDNTNVIFLDGLQSEVSFNAGSVIVNGESKPDFNPQTGFSLGTIQALGSSTVSFKVTVNSLPAEYAVKNFANATFSYKINPNGATYTKTAQSNNVATVIIVGGLSAAKVVDLAYATINDILNYTITVKNTGNGVETSIFFIDTLSNGANFINGSVLVNDVSYPNYNPITGFSLGNILAGNTVVVKFQVKDNSVPVPPQVTNYAAVNGFYRVDPQGPDIPVSATSNTVSTQINVGSIAVNKSVDKDYAKVDDTLIYTSVITNVGNVNATNVSFYDTLQAELMYISGTVSINGVVYPNLNPTTGFSLGDLAPNQSVTVIFDVKINALPVPPQILNKSQVEFSYKIDPSGSIITKTTFSNTATTNVVKGQLTTTKTVDKTIATIGDVLVYTVNITNTGNSIATNVLFQDTPSVGATFKAGSVLVNGVSKPSFDPTVGFSLDDIGIGNVVTVQFSADVLSVPPTNKVTNQAVINYKYIVNPKESPINGTSNSNTVTTNIALGNLSVTKVVDKQFATIGENLTYTVTITNTGNINATNVVFLDPTPQNSVFVTGSVTINGLSYPALNPEAGFPLNTMLPGEIIVVVYKVKVIS
ncbi:conserved repeat domain-containing protein [Clostridium cavendishii DSM 21758]|uniref:Conserved repeat domain-containing protein n=1 Tax=Clostridium cavendishii DSM 21758 TaxID=1121302 RepID=A0A1M6J1Y6_9CLOT|nr:DUF11 domain-containing protein [Clostridium cavendishii]SHJ40708.1 conserved repeat domain-containing protein [Clostridium cavendishii DSM 21758]